LQVDSNQGLGAFAPGFGALNQTNYTPMLHAPLPEKIWFYPIDHAGNSATFQALDSNYKVKIPLHPFLECMGVAPAGGEAAARLYRRNSAGTWMRRKRRRETRFNLPVNVSGALFYFGDGTRPWATAKSPNSD